jgi:hypothetical protein
MSDYKLPNAVGRLDDVVEALRLCDKYKAHELLSAEIERRLSNRKHLCDLYEKEDKAIADCEQVLGIVSRAIHGGGLVDMAAWNQLVRQCGWSGVDGFEGPIETLPPVQPALKAEDLPIGTVMVLAKRTYVIVHNGPMVFTFSNGNNKLLLWWDEVQELIDRGVEFILPEGGGDAG